MSKIDNRNLDPITEMKRIAYSFMNLPAYGFTESYQSVKFRNLIFDSEWCRINLIWGGWDYLGGTNIDIQYGRLHALNEKATMFWNGEECHCWHRIEYALHFIDKRTPVDTARLNYSHPLLETFYEENYREKFLGRQPEWLATIHTAIWQHYRKRLFELFDLRNPQLWQQYRQFLKEVYDIEGRIPEIKPPLDKVC